MCPCPSSSTSTHRQQLLCFLCFLTTEEEAAGRQKAKALFFFFFFKSYSEWHRINIWRQFLHSTHCNFGDILQRLLPKKEEKCVQFVQTISSILESELSTFSHTEKVVCCSQSSLAAQRSPTPLCVLLTEQKQVLHLKFAINTVRLWKCFCIPARFLTELSLTSIIFNTREMEAAEGSRNAVKQGFANKVNNLVNPIRILSKMILPEAGE